MTQARKLEEMMRKEKFMSAMRAKGFEISLCRNGEIYGVKHAKKSHMPKYEFKHFELIKGEKAYYSNEYFKMIGAGIYERETMRLVDILSA